MKAGIRHALPILLATVIGILCGNLTDSFLVSMTALVFAVIIYFFAYKRRALIGPLLFFAVSSISAVICNPVVISSEDRSSGTLNNLNILSGKEVWIEGMVKETLSTTSGERSVVTLSAVYDNSTLYDFRNVDLLLYSSPTLTLNYGDNIRIRGKIAERQDSVPFSSLAQVCMMSARRPLLVCFASGATPEITGHTVSLMTRARNINRSLCDYVDSTPLSTESKSIIKTIIFGNRSAVSSHQRNLFADTGTSHILAVSGMHVGIICAVILFLTLPLHFFKSGYRLRYILCCVIIWIYVIISGLSYSALRAAIMLSFAMIALASLRSRSSFSAVCMAVDLILLCDPHSIYNVGLWLSFICVISIVLVVPRLNIINQSAHPYTHKLFAFILCTIVATFATWMLSAYSFGTVPTHFLISNLLILPFLPIYVMMAGAFLLLYAVMPLPHFIEGPLVRLIDLPPHLLFQLLEELQGDAINVEMPLAYVIVYYISLIVSVIVLYRNTRDRAA